MVSSGIVAEVYGDQKSKLRKTRGGICNIGNICSPQSCNLMELVAISDCKLYKLSIDHVDYFMKKNSKFQLDCYKESFQTFLRYLELNDKPKWEAMQKDIFESTPIEDVFAKASIIELHPNAEESFKHGGVVIQGSLIKMGVKTGHAFPSMNPVNQITVQEFSVVRPSLSIFQAMIPTVVLKFTHPVIKGYRKKSFLRPLTVRMRSPERKSSYINDEDGKSAKSKNILEGIKNDRIVERVMSDHYFNKRSSVRDLPKEMQKEFFDQMLSVHQANEEEEESLGSISISSSRANVVHKQNQDPDPKQSSASSESQIGEVKERNLDYGDMKSSNSDSNLDEDHKLSLNGHLNPSENNNYGNSSQHSNLNKGVSLARAPSPGISEKDKKKKKAAQRSMTEKVKESDDEESPDRVVINSLFTPNRMSRFKNMSGAL